MILKHKCTCSKFCRIHSNCRIATINEIGYECVGINNGIVRNLELKTLMCQLINDRGLLEICKKYGLIVSNLKEIKYNKQSQCLGINKNGHNI